MSLVNQDLPNVQSLTKTFQYELLVLCLRTPAAHERFLRSTALPLMVHHRGGIQDRIPLQRKSKVTVLPRYFARNFVGVFFESF